MQELAVQHEFNLSSNMVEVKASIAETIAKYDIVIGEDQVGEAKTLMATFNKEKKAFSDKCKEFLAVISEPITTFKAQQKDIETMFDDGRAKIADQVEKFEVTKLAEIKEAIRLFRDSICCEKNIHPDSVIVDDLVMLSAVTSGSNLSKKTKESIDARIQAVENEILKARLEAEEKAKRDREIAEQARLEAEERARVREAELIAKAEREKQEALVKAEREQREAVERERLRVEGEDRKRFDEINRKAVESKQQSETIKEQPIPQPSLIDEDGKITHVIYARFEVPAPVGVDPQRIANKIKGIIEGAGITSLKSIEVSNDRA